MISVQNEKEVLEACRKAVLELKAKRELEEALLEKVKELERQLDLKTQQVEIYRSSVAAYQQAVSDYQRAIEERKNAEKAVELLRTNYEAQMKAVEKQLAWEKFKNRILTVVAVVSVLWALFKSQ